MDLRNCVVIVAIVMGVFGGGVRGDEPMTIFDFVADDGGWPSIDDAVMGGVSSSAMTVADGFATFRGVVSFENNGGFASVRSRPEVRDLSAYDGLIVRARGDGKSYGLRIRTSASFDGVSYQVVLAPPAAEWSDVVIPFSDFVPVWRGKRVEGHPVLDSSIVTTFGLIISRQEGQFQIDIQNIRGYRKIDSPEASR